MRQASCRMQQAGTRQGAHRRAPARHLPAGRLALCRSLHTAITRFLGRFSWSCGYKAQAAIEQKLEPTLFGWHWFSVMGTFLPFEIITYAI